MSDRPIRAIFIDMAYTFEMVVKKGHLRFLDARHAGGWISEVWSIHPLADLTVRLAKRIEFRRPLPKQILVEAASGVSGGPKWLRPSSFAVNQCRLLILAVRLARSRKIDLIVTGDPFYSGLLALAVRFLTKVPVVVCVWGNYDLAYRSTGSLGMPRLIPSYRLQRMVTRFTLSRADRVVVGNLDNRGYVLDNGAPPDRTSVVPVVTVLDDHHFTPPAQRPASDLFARHGIAADAKCMIFIGRLITVKYPDDAVSAMITVAQADPRAIGIVAGEGYLAEALKAKVAAAGLADRIIFTGNISQQALSEILPRCVTISAITGMALIESGLAGSPIVAFDVDWQAEFVTDYRNGFIVPLHDVAAMAKRVCEIFADEELYARLARQSREAALAFADQERARAAQREAYSLAIAHRRRTKG